DQSKQPAVSDAHRSALENDHGLPRSAPRRREFQEESPLRARRPRRVTFIPEITLIDVGWGYFRDSETLSYHVSQVISDLDVDSSRADAELVDVAVELVGNGHHQVRERR